MTCAATSQTTQETPTRVLIDSIQKALEFLESKEFVLPDLFEKAQLALGALPLTSGEYTRYLANIRNADSYSQQSEFGAAKFELRLLLNSL